MKPRSPLALIALAVSLLALVATLGGGAYAVAKIGKNQVVTKSIKNGAVTTPKIRTGAVNGASVANGSLTSADLAPGTVPPSGSGKSAVMASIADLTAAGNGSTVMAPSGAYNNAEESFVGIAPVAMELSDLRAVTSQQGIGQAVKVDIESGPALGGSSVVLSCTIGSGTSTCSNPAKATIPAGDIFFFRITNGPGGAVGGFLAASYTVRVP